MESFAVDCGKDGPNRRLKLAKHAHSNPEKPSSSILALVGGESLLGREARETIESAGLPARLEVVGALADQPGELTAAVPLRPEELKPAAAVILAGTAESARQAAEIVEKLDRAPVLIDLTGTLEDKPASRLRAPFAEDERRGPAPIIVIAHPAAAALALFLRRLHRVSPIRSSVVLILEPASERGQRGLDELQQQTVGLLSLKKLKKQVYDAQIGFNVLARYGEDAPQALEDIELRIDRHLATLLAADTPVPMPSLRVLQAPVFHGYSMSLWVEFEQRPSLEKLEGDLATAEIEVRTKDTEAPSNVGAAGQSGITVGEIAADRNNPRAFWFWVVADNLRVTAENAVEVAREVLS